MGKGTKISVIVPVYNEKSYLRDCVHSVLAQTHTDFELILIDDGSEDGSRELCEMLCTEDERIRLIVQKHSGVSAARNAGMDAANGKYVFFLDSDDLIHPQLLEALYELQETNHTIIATVGLYYAKEGEFKKPTSWKTETNYVEKSCYLGHDKAGKPVFLTHSKTKLCAIGGKMILREAVKTMRFDEDLTHSEDTLFLCQLIADGADVSVLLRKWYYYRRTEGSSSMCYSVESCRSRYKAQRAICDRKIRDGRLSDAIYTQWCLLCEMMLWREMGRKNYDIELIKYVESIIRTEMDTKTFSKIGRCRRMVLYLGYIYYPLYKLMGDVVHWYHENLDFPRELHRG